MNSAYACKAEDTEKSVEIGNEVTLCLQARTFWRKVAFKIKVDDYIISIEEGFSKLITSENAGARRLETRHFVKEGYDDIEQSPNEQTGWRIQTPLAEEPSTPE